MVRLPENPPALLEAISQIRPPKMRAVLAVGPTVGGRYLHWDELRRRRPPDGLTVEEWWAGLAMGRNSIAKPSPIDNVEATPFRYSLVDPVLEKLHYLDLRAAGRLAVPIATLNPVRRGSYRVRGIIEEAISSSKLEGAVTTRVRAKEMLQSGHRPRDHSERMIFNNYKAIHHIKDMIDKKMTPELICEIHAILTEGTLDNPDDCGRFQRKGDMRAEVVDSRDEDLIFRPPPAEEIAKRIGDLCDFANGANGGFTHPLLRSIMLHFWLAYIHPFADGNGRTARALFYWSALRDGYWLMEYVSLSAVLLNAPAQYRDSFLYSETADNDMTYFLIHQLNALEKAFNDLSEYVDRVLERSQEAERLVGDVPGLNYRQRALLADALQNTGRGYTFLGHANRHDIARATARNDLLFLVDSGLMKTGQNGKQKVFFAPSDLNTKLKAMRSLA